MMMTDPDEPEYDSDADQVCPGCYNCPCRCDKDDTNPVDLTVDEWREVYADPDYEDYEP